MNMLSLKEKTTFGLEQSVPMFCTLRMLSMKQTTGSEESLRISDNFTSVALSPKCSNLVSPGHFNNFPEDFLECEDTSSHVNSSLVWISCVQANNIKSALFREHTFTLLFVCASEKLLNNNQIYFLSFPFN